MKVYIVRHGESETNLQKKWTGWLDVELTDKGIEDAKKVTPVLKDIVFDKVYASDLKRAKKTAEIALPNYKFETSSLLREIDVGNFAGKPLSIYDTLTPEEKELNLKNAFKDFGGESVEDLTKRVETFIKELETKDFNNVAIFCHGGWQMAMVDYVIGYRYNRSRIRFGNCAILIVEYVNNIWRIIGLQNL